MKESEIQSQILEYLLLKGHFCWRNNTGAFRWTDRHGGERLQRFGKVGSSDIIGMQKGTGRFIAIEVKQPGKDPTDDQREFITEVRASGGLAFVATKLEDVRAQGL